MRAALCAVFCRRYGVGGLWPKFGQVVGLAMQMGRVYIVGTLFTRWERNAYCGEGSHFDTCFFMPFSNCTLDHALQGRNISDVPEFNNNLAYTPNASAINPPARRLLQGREVRACLRDTR